MAYGVSREVWRRAHEPRLVTASMLRSLQKPVLWSRNPFPHLKVGDVVPRKRSFMGTITPFMNAILSPMDSWQFWAGIAAGGAGFALGHLWGSSSATFIGQWMGQAGAAYLGVKTAQYAGGAVLAGVLGTETDWGRVLGLVMMGGSFAYGAWRGVAAGYDPIIWHTKLGPMHL